MTDRPMNAAPAKELAQTLMSRCCSREAFAVSRSLLDLLVEGEPIRVVDLAEHMSLPPTAVHELLRAMPDVEKDSQGRIVGNGLTLHQTPHRFIVGGRTLFTWCAWDALTFPPMLGRTARVESTCAGTGAEIRLTVAPTGVLDLQPPNAVISLAHATACPSSCGIRERFCDHVHFFRSAQDGQAWLREQAGGSLVPVQTAFELGIRVQELYTTKLLSL